MAGGLRYAGLKLALSGVSLVAGRRPSGGRGVIFTLHHVRPARGAAYDPNGILSVTPEFLEEAIGVAREAGATFVAVEDLPALLADPADRRYFCAFTLDDGYRDNAVFAAPVFRRHGVPYTIFVTAGLAERRSTMWWQTAEKLTRECEAIRFDFGAGVQRVDLGSVAARRAAFARLAHFVAGTDEDIAVQRIDRTARENGVDPAALVEELVMDVGELQALAADPLVRFGGHTLTHVNLKRVDEGRLRREIEGSTEALTRYFGKRPRAFAFPYGSKAAGGEREARAVAEAGYALGVTTQPGVLSAGMEFAALPRISLNGHFQSARYVRALMSGLAFKLMR